MSAFLQIATGFNVLPTLLELRRQPELWDEYTERRDAAGSPHSQMSDIWLRYRPRVELERSAAAYGEAHRAEFYPAWFKLPSLRPLVFRLMALVEAVELGGIMITRIPAGGVIAPHDDRGSWHAEHFRTKVYVPLLAPEKCVNHCGDEGVVMRAGDAWIFDNLVRHSVDNSLGAHERMTLIVCMRAE